MTLFYLILFGVSIFGFIFSTALLVKKKPVAYYFFTGVYLIFNFSLFVNLLIPLGYIDEMPHLYRVLSPLQFLFGPFCYFFFRATLRPYQKFKKIDWLHFVPFGLSIIGLIPIFTLSVEEKLRLIELGKDFKTGWHLGDTFGMEYVVALRLKFIIFFSYLFVQWKMFLGFMKNASIELKNKNHSLQVWLLFDIILKSLICIIVFVSTWLENSANMASMIQMTLVCVEVIGSAFFLIASPDLLKGVVFQDIMKGPQYGEKTEMLQGPEVVFGNQVAIPVKKESKEIMLRIEQFLQLEQPFLDPEFSISDLAFALNLPVRVVSSAIKTVMSMGFPEYINKKRLIYLEEQLSTNPEMRRFSVDALARSVGFNSRSGFYKAFKKAGPDESPSKMIAMIKERVGRQD